MQIKDVYALPVFEEGCEEYRIRGCTYDFLDLLNHGGEIGKQERLVIKCHGSVRHDARRYWELCSFWFGGKPFMVTRNAGREGDDFTSRHITDFALFNQARGWVLHCLALHGAEEIADVVPADFEEDFLSFYGERIAAGRSVDRGYGVTGY